MQAEDFVFAAAALASRCQNCAHHEHANRHRRSQMREAGEQTGRIESRDWKREEHSNLCTIRRRVRGKGWPEAKILVGSPRTHLVRQAKRDATVLACVGWDEEELLNL